MIEWVTEIAKTTMYNYDTIIIWYDECKSYNGFDIQDFKMHARIQKLWLYREALKIMN